MRPLSEHLPPVSLTSHHYYPPTYTYEAVVTEWGEGGVAGR